MLSSISTSAPTFDSKGKRIVEVHILNHNNYNLYDSKIEVMFVKKIRDEMKFPHTAKS